jgi:uncharacterized membrane protein (GlpM family)
MEIKYFFYFLTGGIVVSVVTYFASHAKGLLAAFFANLPVVTMITFLTIYFESGEKAVVSYAEGLVVMLFPWLAYIFSVVFLTKKIGLLPSLVIGVFFYLVCAYFIMSAKKLF